jgi:hypothetical protein
VSNEIFEYRWVVGLSKIISLCILYIGEVQIVAYFFDLFDDSRFPLLLRKFQSTHKGFWLFVTPLSSRSKFVIRMEFLFGKKAALTTKEKKMDPADLAKQWRRNLAKEARVIDRDVSFFDCILYAGYLCISQLTYCLHFYDL